MTGSSRGICREIALASAKEDAKVCANYFSSKEDGSIGGEAIMTKVDVSNKQEVERMFEEVVNKFSKIDILVNNARIFYRNSILSLDEEKLDAMRRVNVKGAIYCICEAVKHMIKRCYGKIMNTSRTAAIGTA